MVTEALTLVVVMKVPPRRLRLPLTAHGPDLPWVTRTRPDGFADRDQTTAIVLATS
jgi:hypothetical protein